MAGKVSKKELKAPDFLQVQFGKLMTFLSRHRSKAYLFLALILFLIAATAGWYLYRMNYEKSALKIYNQVEMLKLKNNNEGDNAKIIDGFRNVAVKYPDSRASLHAYYQLGNLYLNMNQIDLSMRAYDEFIKRAPENNYLKIFAYMGKGYCYEAKKDLKKALLSFETALKISEGKNFQGQIYRDMGRIYEEMNDTGKSLEYYRKSLEKTNDPTMEIIIKRKIASLS